MASPQLGLIQVLGKSAAKHLKVSGVADSGDVALVQPSDWNEAHVGPAHPLLQVGGPAADVWTSMPAGLTELYGLTYLRTIADLTLVSHARIVANLSVAGTVTAELRVQYTTDLTGATGWAYLDGSAGPAASLAATGLIYSALSAVTALARTTVLLRVVGIDG